MATSMARGRGCFNLPRHLYKTTVRHSSTGTGAYGPYYVLVPEVPDDTPETNPILRYQDFPKFSSFKPDNLLTGGAKVALDFDIKFGKHEESLKDQKQDKTFESVFHAVEEISAPLHFTILIAAQLRLCKGSDHFLKAYERIDSQIGRVQNERWLSEPMYNSVKEVLADSDNLTDYQRRLAEIYERQAKVNGIELKGLDSKKMLEALNLIYHSKYAFRTRVDICKKMFSHVIQNFNVIKDMPESLVHTMSEDKISPTRGPWKVSLEEPSYSIFMKYCNDRMTRWTVWHAHNNMSSQVHASTWLDNIESLEKLRLYRSDIAKFLGYENFIEYSMDTKMAGSLENVVNMIDTLKNNFHSVAVEEINTLQDYAESERFPHTLQMWDIPYYRRKHYTQVFRLQRDELSEYFPLPKVLNSLFDFCTKLFGITFKQRYDCDTWHSDVSVYDVIEEGQYVGSFYLDPYRRQNKAAGYMLPGRYKSALMNTTPLCYLSLNLVPPFVKTNPGLMNINDVFYLYHSFGRVLQELLTKVPYTEISGSVNYMEMDAQPICSHFMKNWLSQPEILQGISSHCETGQSLPDEVVERLLAGRRHMFAFDMMHECYLSAFDLECHLGTLDWDDTMKKVWEIYMPVELDREDRHPCSFLDIFSGNKEAAYYSDLWAQMVAADVFEAFKEGGLENKDNLSILGKRFRETYLAHAAGIKASEVFRQFRGRDPSIKAFLKHNNADINENIVLETYNSHKGLPLDPAITR